MSTKALKKIALAGLCVVSWVFYNSCGSTHFSSVNNGTAVGNPFSGTNSILEALCSAITRCDGVANDTCRSGILATSGVGPTLGLQAFTGTYSALVQAEQTGTVVSNTSNVDGCVSAIGSLSCSSPLVQGAYDPNAAAPFSGVSSMISSGTGTSCSSALAPVITQWKFVDGNTNNGLNFNPAGESLRPFLAVLNSKLYSMWPEINPATGAHQIRAAVYNGNDSQPSWSFVDGAGVNGLNYDATKDASMPRALAVNSKLYAVWWENGANGQTQMRVKVYNGSDAAPAWSFADGGAGTGINHDPAQSASWQGTAVFNSKLYVAWHEGTTPRHVYVKVYNGNDAAPSWTEVSGSATGVAVNPAMTGGEPKLAVNNSKLYMVWTEYSATTNKKQIRVAAYNGNDAAPAWTPVDGGGATGLNKNTGLDAQGGDIMTSGGQLFVTWSELNSSGVSQVRVAAYNGNDAQPAWSLVDGNGANGMNFDPAQAAATSTMFSYNSALYLAWSEHYSNGAYQVHVSAFNGSMTAPAWVAVDGGTFKGLNHDDTGSGYSIESVIFNSKPYLTWHEYNGTAYQTRVVVGQ